MAKLFRVILPVSDIGRATTFYGALLGQPGERVSPGRHYFDCEGVVLACYDAKADGDEPEATAASEPLYFAVDDLRATFDRARAAGGSFSSDDVAGVGRLGEIAERPWGETSFYMSDPFGNRICFVTRGSAFTGAVRGDT